MKPIYKTALTFVLTSAALAFSAPSFAAEKLTTTIDDSYKVDGFSWAENGDMMYVWTAIDVDGKLAVCGAFSSKGNSIGHKFNKAALREMKLVVDGTTVMRSMLFFKNVQNEGRETRHVGATANCRVTKQATPPKGTPIELVARKGNYKIKVKR